MGVRLILDTRPSARCHKSPTYTTRRIVSRKITHRDETALLQSIVYGAEVLIRSCAR